MQKIVREIKNRMPGFRQIIPVYAVISLIIYSWALYWFLHELPAWIKYLSAVEIFSLYLYVLLVNFIESLAILFALIVFCIVTPKRWFSDDFTYRGILLSLIVNVYLIYLATQRTTASPLSIPLSGTELMVALLTIVLIILFFGKNTWVRNIIYNLADRTIIFLYIYIPASISAILLIVIRSIL